MNAIAGRQLSVGASLGKRTLLAGGAATAALIGAVAIVLFSLAAYVAFEGFPTAEAGSERGAVALDGSSGAPEVAARALAAAPAALERARRDGTRSTAASGSAREPGGPADAAPAPAVPGAGALSEGEMGAGVITPRGADTGSSSAGLGETVNGTGASVENAAGLGLGEAASQLTEPLVGTVDEIGSAIGAPGLGSSVEDATGRRLDH